MKVLVTGGAGFIGSHVVEGFLAAGHEVVVIDNFSTGTRQNLPPGVRCYNVDLRDPALIEVFARERPEVVNHHAAQASVNLSVQNPTIDATVNILGSLNLLTCCKVFPVRKFLYASTGGAMFGDPQYLPVDEEHPVAPLSPYGASKHTVAHYLHLYHTNFDLDYTVLAYPNIYGPRQDPYGEAGVVAIFTRQMLDDAPVTINGTGDQERDFIYVGDIVRANLLALDRGAPTTYLTGSNAGISVNTIFRELARITGYRREPRHGPLPPGEVTKIAVSGEKIGRDLGWKPEVSLADGLERTVEYFRRAASPVP